MQSAKQVSLQTIMLRHSKSAEELQESVLLEPKVFLNEYGFQVRRVRVLGPKGVILWECADPDVILGSSAAEVKMKVGVQ